MEYLVGSALAIAVGAFIAASGFDRDRSAYPLILVVIASYYCLFAVMEGSSALFWETGVLVAFALSATIGFRMNLWIVVVALAGHGVLDWYHNQLISNAGVPAWWPTFCLSFDAAAGAFLAWRLISRKIEASNYTAFGKRIHPHVEAELAAAAIAELSGDPYTGFHHLERAHILGQRSTVQHVRVHLRMLMWGIRHQNRREVFGQILRVLAATAGSWVGLVPHGNTGGANVNAFTQMAIPNDLSRQIERALRRDCSHCRQSSKRHEYTTCIGATFPPENSSNVVGLITGRFW